MGRYSLDGQDTNTAGTTILYMIGDTTIRPRVYDLILGSDATPADNAAEYVLQRISAEHGTPGGSAVTPRPLDFDDPASVVTAVEAPTGEPTYTADVIVLQWAQNQRATFRWVAAPGGEIVVPALAGDGVGIQCITIAGAAVNTNAMMHFME